jgi:hypothetical protein
MKKSWNFNVVPMFPTFPMFLYKYRDVQTYEVFPGNRALYMSRARVNKKKRDRSTTFYPFLQTQ